MATIGLAHVENPLEFGIVITREDGSIERFLEKPTWGQVFSDTINTGHLRARARDLRLHRRRPSRRLLRARSSPACSRTASPSSAPSPRATGRTSARSRPTSAPTRTSSTARSTSTSRASRCVPGVWLGEGAEVHPDADPHRPGGDRRQLPDRGRRHRRRVHGARGQRAGPQRSRSSSAPSCSDNAYLGDGVRLRGTVVGRVCDLRNGRAHRGGRRASATSASSARRPCSARA